MKADLSELMSQLMELPEYQRTQDEGIKELKDILHRVTEAMVTTKIVDYAEILYLLPKVENVFSFESKSFLAKQKIFSLATKCNSVPVRRLI